MRVGSALVAAGDEWGAVPLFYCSYHLARAALIRDPIFADLPRLKAVNSDLTPDERYTARHHGRRGSAIAKQWGLNELVALLYPRFSHDYEVMHQASIDVRYGRGFRGDLLRLEVGAIAFRDSYSDGDFVAA
jgi:hypothetical protein